MARETSSCGATRRRRFTCRASSGFWHVYGDAGDDESFCRRFIGWDRACPDGEAARIVTEICRRQVDDAGRIARLSDEAVKGAIRWMANATSHAVADRAELLARALRRASRGNGVEFIEFLETSGTLDDAEFRRGSTVVLSERSDQRREAVLRGRSRRLTQSSQRTLIS